MQNRLISGIIFIILGLSIAVGPQTIFPVCGAQGSAQTSGQKSMQMNGQGTKQSDAHCTMSKNAASTGMVMRCFGTGQAEIGIGSLIAVLGLLLILFSSKQIRIGLSFALILNSVLALLIPTALIGVCSDAHLTCRTLALPALTILSAIASIVAIINTIYLYRTAQEGSKA